MKHIRNRRGQIIVEYILLMVIAVALASMVISQMAKRDKDNPGALVAKWNSILSVIGNDLPDSSK